MATSPSSVAGPANSGACPKPPATGYCVHGRAPDGRRWFVTATEADAEIVLRLSATGRGVARLHLERTRSRLCLDGERRPAAVIACGTREGA